MRLMKCKCQLTLALDFRLPSPNSSPTLLFPPRLYPTLQIPPRLHSHFPDSLPPQSFLFSSSSATAHLCRKSACPLRLRTTYFAPQQYAVAPRTDHCSSFAFLSLAFCPPTLSLVPPPALSPTSPALFPLLRFSILSAPSPPPPRAGLSHWHE